MSARSNFLPRRRSLRLSLRTTLSPRERQHISTRPYTPKQQLQLLSPERSSTVFPKLNVLLAGRSGIQDQVPSRGFNFKDLDDNGRVERASTSSDPRNYAGSGEGYFQQSRRGYNSTVDAPALNRTFTGKTECEDDSSSTGFSFGTFTTDTSVPLGPSLL